MIWIICWVFWIYIKITKLFLLQKISLFPLQNPWGGRQKVRQEAKDGHCGAFVLKREKFTPPAWLGIDRAPIWLGKKSASGLGNRTRLGTESSEDRGRKGCLGGGGGWQQVRIAANLHFCVLVHPTLFCFSSCFWHSFYLFGFTFYTSPFKEDLTLEFSFEAEMFLIKFLCEKYQQNLL